MSTKPTAPTYMLVFRGRGDMCDLSPEEMQQTFQHWMTWIAKLKAQGQYLAGDPLEESPAQVVRGPRGAKVTDGPYAEAKEVVGGYMLIQAKNFADAVRIAQDCPGLAREGCVEVRQLMPMPA